MNHLLGKQPKIEREPNWQKPFEPILLILCEITPLLPQQAISPNQPKNKTWSEPSRLFDRYKDDEDENKPTYYVLVKMSFEEMKDVLQQAQELDAEVREFVRKNAEKAFKKLEEEEAKRPGGL